MMLGPARAVSSCTAAKHGAVAVGRGIAGRHSVNSSMRVVGHVSVRGRLAQTHPDAGWGCLRAMVRPWAGCAHAGSQPARLLSVGFVEWSEAEDAALCKLVEAAGGLSPELDWTEVAGLLGTGRAGPALAHRWDQIAKEAYARAEAEADAKDAEWGAVKDGEWNGPVGPEPTRCVPTLHRSCASTAPVRARARVCVCVCAAQLTSRPPSFDRRRYNDWEQKGRCTDF